MTNLPYIHKDVLHEKLLMLLVTLLRIILDFESNHEQICYSIYILKNNYEQLSHKMKIIYPTIDIRCYTYRSNTTWHSIAKTYITY